MSVCLCFIVRCPASLNHRESYVRMAHPENERAYEMVCVCKSIFIFTRLQLLFTSAYTRVECIETLGVFVSLTDISSDLHCGTVHIQCQGSKYEFICSNHCSTTQQITRLTVEDDVLCKINVQSSPTAFAQTTN